LNKGIKIILIILAVLTIDQSLKFWVKLNMEYGESISLLGNDVEYAFLHFVENPGMAFGMTLGGDYGKLALSLFRIFAVGFLAYYLFKLIKQNAPFGILTGFALILAGALGNIIDSAFYGLIFSESPYHGGLATLFPKQGGYESFLHGRVVDMLYFPIWNGALPEWLPFVGGKNFLFFQPVFNIADAAITLGVLNIIIFQRKYFNEETNNRETNKEGASATQHVISGSDE
jgi:signal peptidase II